MAADTPSPVSPLPFDGERADLIALLVEMYDAGCDYGHAREIAAHDLADARQKRDADEAGLRFQSAKDALAAALLDARKDAERLERVRDAVDLISSLPMHTVKLTGPAMSDPWMPVQMIAREQVLGVLNEALADA